MASKEQHRTDREERDEMTTDQINAATGFANGEQFQSAEEVRAYFTVENMREMFGLQDGSRYSQDDLDRMAEQVIESGFHCRFTA